MAKISYKKRLSITTLNIKDIYNRIKIIDGVKVFHGDIIFFDSGITELPDFSDIKVIGTFSCSNNMITSLKGCPFYIQDGFYCYNNLLTSLKGGPSIVGGKYNCNHNPITSLKGCAHTIHGDLHCTDCILTSLEGAPEVLTGSFKCDNYTKVQFNKYVEDQEMLKTLDPETRELFSEMVSIL